MLRWPGRGDRRGFAATPLSPAVPLDGTDTVQGLRQLAREADVGRIEGLLGAAARNGAWWWVGKRSDGTGGAGGGGLGVRTC